MKFETLKWPKQRGSRDGKRWGYKILGVVPKRHGEKEESHLRRLKTKCI